MRLSTVSADLRRCPVRILLCFTMAAFGLAALMNGQTSAPVAKPYTPPRTPDGQPDMQGMYTRNGAVGLEAHPPENPIDPSGKNALSVSARAGDELHDAQDLFAHLER